MYQSSFAIIIIDFIHQNIEQKKLNSEKYAKNNTVLRTSTLCKLKLKPFIFTEKQS